MRKKITKLQLPTPSYGYVKCKRSSNIIIFNGSRSLQSHYFSKGIWHVIDRLERNPNDRGRATEITKAEKIFARVTE